MKRFKILDIITEKYNLGMRIIKGERFKSDNHRAIQYHSGGDDYCPSDNVETLVKEIGNNASTAVLSYKDQIERKSAKGEKRIYATDENGSEIQVEIHLKNNGDIYIKANKDAKVEIDGNAEVKVNGHAEIEVTEYTTLTTPLFTINGTTLFNGNVNFGTVEGGGSPEIDGTATMKTTAVLNNQGTINNTGAISGTGTISSNGKVLATHVHSGVQSGISNTGGPV